jgi:nitroreductase
MLNLSVNELLTTTRAVRKRLDLERKVAPELIAECLRVAVQAPMASNAQEARFLVVTDQGQRDALARVYAKAFATYREVPGSVFDNADNASAADRGGFDRVGTSAQYLADNLARVPVLIIPVMPGRFEMMPPPLAVVRQATAYASVFPAVWNFQLAARARGLGTTLTTVHLLHEREAADILGIPFHAYTQCALLPVAHTQGDDFSPAKRMPVEQFAYVDDWGEPWSF